MRRLGWILALLLLAAVAAGAWVRLAPSDPAIWHVDPASVARTGMPNDWLVGPGGDAGPIAFADPPEVLAARLDALAMATPRTTRLAGQGTHVTYVTRSRLWGFPDYSSVRITADGTGSRLMIYARARFGRSDLGVNRKRVEDWLARLAP